jgi:hypothetical protein
MPRINARMTDPDPAHDDQLVRSAGFTLMPRRAGRVHGGLAESLPRDVSPGAPGVLGAQSLAAAVSHRPDAQSVEVGGLAAIDALLRSRSRAAPDAARRTADAVHVAYRHAIRRPGMRAPVPIGAAARRSPASRPPSTVRACLATRAQPARGLSTSRRPHLPSRAPIRPPDRARGRPPPGWPSARSRLAGFMRTPVCARRLPLGAAPRAGHRHSPDTVVPPAGRRAVIRQPARRARGSIATRAVDPILLRSSGIIDDCRRWADAPQERRPPTSRGPRRVRRPLQRRGRRRPGGGGSHPPRVPRARGPPDRGAFPPGRWRRDAFC